MLIQLRLLWIGAAAPGLLEAEDAAVEVDRLLAVSDQEAGVVDAVDMRVDGRYFPAFCISTPSGSDCTNSTSMPSGSLISKA